MRSGLPQMQKGQKSKIDVSNSRTVKRGIRSVKDSVRNDGDDLTDIKSNKLTDRVHELNQISKHVERPSEQADDSEVFYTLTQKGAEMAKRVAAGKGRSANDFIRHLKAAYVEDLEAQQEGEIDPHAFNWTRLSRRVSKYFKYAPGVSCLLGPLDAEVKVRKQVQRQARKPVGEVIAPKILQSEDLEAQEKRETEKNMEVMWSYLRRHPDGVGFLELTMNMQSFAQFCENCFTLSFLIHNKRARMAKSENNNSKGILVFPYNEKTAKQDGTAKALDQDRAQFILNYTTADWEEWKRYVQPDDCLMPHRSIPAEDAEATGLEEAGPSDRYEEGGEGPSLQNGAADHAAKSGRSRKRRSEEHAQGETEGGELPLENGDRQDGDSDVDDSEDDRPISVKKSRKERRKK